MTWYGSGDLADRSVIPLAVLERPCRFREAAIASLNAAGRSWRIAVETPNLTTLRAAVEAGLGLTCRTHLFLPAEVSVSALALPPLPKVACIIGRSNEAGQPTLRLSELAATVVREL